MPLLWSCLAVLLTTGLTGCGGVSWPLFGDKPQVVNRSGGNYGQRSPTSSGSIQVQRGDTVWGLSRRYGLSVRAIIDANGLKPPYLLYTGQRLNLPAPPEHRVVRGDTLNGIAQLYGVNRYELARANGLRPPYLIRVGERLRLPSGAAPRVAAAPSSPSPTTTSPPTSKPSSPGSTRRVSHRPAPAKPAVPPPPAGSGKFAWPLKGIILSDFGTKESGLHNDGINIAAQRGDAVRAAENGVIAYAGNELRGFGNLLLIKHASGWVTAYAHNDALLVKRGDTVKKGQVIAKAGSTGTVSTPQLHFELRKGKQTVNPRKYLG